MRNSKFYITSSISSNVPNLGKRPVYVWWGKPFQWEEVSPDVPFVFTLEEAKYLDKHYHSRRAALLAMNDIKFWRSKYETIYGPLGIEDVQYIEI